MNQEATAVKRCRLNSLTSRDRHEISLHELAVLRRQYSSGEVDRQIVKQRRRAIEKFLLGKSDRIDSNGVLVEFFVGDPES